MILIADSGSTKTDWRLINGENITQFSTIGLNPVYRSSSEIKEVLVHDLTPNIDRLNIKEIYFYGAGCMSFEKADKIKETLNGIFVNSKVNVSSDILAAARAAASNKEAIVAILGTGANICHYNGKQITETRSGLGYILGDEGSGAVIGKEFIKSYLNKDFSDELNKRIFKKIKLTKKEIIDLTYNQESPNLFFAQYSKYVFQLRKEPIISELIVRCFTDFFEKHVIKFTDYDKLPLHIVGSVGFYFSDYIKKVALNYGVHVDTVLEKPIAGLTLYHLNS